MADVSEKKKGKRKASEAIDSAPIATSDAAVEETIESEQPSAKKSKKDKKIKVDVSPAPSLMLLQS